MTNPLDELKELFGLMQTALVANDVDAVQALTLRQQSCMSRLMEEVQRDPQLKLKAQSEYSALQSQLLLNQQLIEQALSLNNTLIMSIKQSQAETVYRA